MTVPFRFFAGDLVIGPVVKVDDIFRQRVISTESCARATVGSKTPGFLEGHFIPWHAVEKVQMIMIFVSILLAPKGDAEVQTADSIPTTEREVGGAILVIGQSKKVGHRADSPLGIHNKPKLRTGVVHQRGAEVGDNRPELNDKAPACLHGNHRRRNGNVPVLPVS